MPYSDPIKQKEASSKRWKSWAQRNPEKANSRMKEWRHRNPKYMLNVSAKRRSIRDGIEYSITVEDIPDIPTICPIAQIPIFPRDDGNKGPCDNSPTLDRIDPEKGYVPGNLRIISHKANRWKSNMTIKDVEVLLAYMRGEV